MFHFVEEFLKITKIVESPTSYLEWAAYVTIGAILKNRVYYNFPARKTIVTPNMYVLLVGDSGSTRKATPLKLVNFMVKSIDNTKMIEGRASIQGVLKELAMTRTRQGKLPLSHAVALLYSEELAAFLVKDPQAGAILTDLYDYKQTHDVVLKSEERLELKEVCVSLISATNAAFMQDMFTKQDLFGGFVGRTFFIIEDKARHKDLGLRDTTKDEDWDPLLNHLRKLSLLQGSVILEEDALDYLERWYHETDFVTNESKTGYEHRAHTHVEKIALILAACEENFKLVVRKDHILKAIQIVSNLRRNYHKLLASVGISSNTVVQAIKDIVALLFQNVEKEYTKADLLNMLFGKVDSETFDKAVITLEQAKLIRLGGTRESTYRLSDLGKEKLLGQITSGRGRGKELIQ